MDKIDAEKQAELMKLSEERLTAKVLAAGIYQKELEHLTKPQLLNMWVDLSLKVKTF